MSDRLPNWLKNSWVIGGISFLGSALVCLLIYIFVLQGFLATVLTDQGIAAMEEGHYVTATEKFASALSLKDDREEIYLNYAKALIASKKYKEAAELIDEGIDRISGSVDLYLCRVEALVSEGKIGEAADFLDNIKDSYIDKELQDLRPGDISYSPTKGSYDTSQRVTMTVRPNETIYYTLNGSTPTLSSPIYTEPITVASSVTIHAIAVSKDKMVSPHLIIPYDIDNAEEAIEFEDVKIEKMVRNALNKPSGKIYGANLVKITALNNDGVSGDIKTLKDLQYMPNLTTLTLDNEMLIEDYTPLASLTGLCYLSMADCALSNNELAFLNSCANLVKLDLRGNDITSMAALNALTKLDDLNLSNNDIASLNSIAGFTELVSLNLSFNKIRSIAPLSALVNLETLILSGNNEIKLDLSPLASLSALIELNLSETDPVDLKAIKDLPNLASVNVSDCNLTSLDAFNGFKSAACIIAEENDITSLSTFTKQVTELNLKDNPIADISPLAKQSGLIELTLGGCNKLSDISALAGHKNLVALDITDTKVTDATALKDCPALRYLYCESNCTTSALPSAVSITHG